MKYLRICDIGKVITGKTPNTECLDYYDGLYPFITPTDIKTFNERYINETERTISELGLQKVKNCILSKDSICFVCVGSTIGKMCLVKQKSISNQQINSIIVNQHFNPKYVFYNLRYNKGYFQLIGGGTGSGKGIVKKSTFEKIKLPIISSIEIQDKIDLVLSKYDDFIENNNKRINLLEQMAEELYKEWFVRFRFPGYENVKTKSQSSKGWMFGNNENGQSIPEMWDFGELKILAEFIRGKNITSSEMIEGAIPVISAGLEPSGYHNSSSVNGYSLTISASGANAGYLSYHLEDIWAADCSYYSNKSNLWFIYNALNFLQPVIKNMQIGSAQPHVYAKNINRISTIIPSPEMINLFIEKVTPLYEEIRVLKQKNNNLIIQRDSLLPRLMSGKIDLEDKEVI